MPGFTSLRVKLGAVKASKRKYRSKMPAVPKRTEKEIDAYVSKRFKGLKALKRNK